MTLKLIVATALSMALSYTLGIYMIPWLRDKKKAGQNIKEIGPSWHMSKAGTPAMGGVFFIVSTAVTLGLFGSALSSLKDYRHIILFVFAFLYGIIGFIDDYSKVKKKQNTGLTSKSKFALQIFLALALVLFLRKMNYLSESIYVPFFNTSFRFPPVLYYIFMVIFIVGTVNSVNITDGVDGLAAGTSVPVLAFFVVLCLFWGGYYSIGIFAAALLGGLIGFLGHNFFPAKVFMGDTGSLFLGGSIAGLAILYDMPLILLLLCLLFVIETLSDIIQVSYFKLSGGKRVFKMAPFHHHLEMGGWTGKKWSETELFKLYISISIVCAILSFIGVYKRF